MGSYRVTCYFDFEFEVEAENCCEAKDKAYRELKETYKIDGDDLSDMTIKKMGKFR